MTPAALSLAAWLHDLSPFLVRISGDFGIRWYGLSYAAGFAIAWWLLGLLARRGLTYIPAQRTTDAILAMVVGVVLGGRLGYILFYDPDLLWTFSNDPPWWGLLMVNRGGMASHGAMIGVILAAVYISRRLLAPARTDPPPGAASSQSQPRRIPVFHIFDVMAIICPVGLCLGRLANFVNGELLGKIYAPPGAPAPWWTVRFPQEHLEAKLAPALTPDQAHGLAALVDRTKLPSESFTQGYHSLVERIQHGDKQLAAQLEPFLSARYPSQLFQAAAEGVVLGLALFLIWYSPRRPGVIGACFVIIYGVLRVITEFWRLPDAHLAVQRIAGLSRGQWLSVLMVVAGAALLGFIRARGGERIAGWGPHARKLNAPSPEPS